jgi:chromosome segregation ATPase
MIEGSLGLVVESLVCVLLAATIFYCISVNRKLERLRSEQKGMQSFIRELSIATTNADKAIYGLRQTVEASGDELAGQIERARHMSRQLNTEIEKSEQMMNRLVVLAGGVEQRRAETELQAAPSNSHQPGGQVGRSVEELRRAMMGFDELEQPGTDTTDGFGRTIK